MLYVAIPRFSFSSILFLHIIITAALSGRPGNELRGQLLHALQCADQVPRSNDLPSSPTAMLEDPRVRVSLSL